jgi:hypothetical protein
MEHDPLVVSLKQQPKIRVASEEPRPRGRTRWVPYAALIVLIGSCMVAGYYGYIYYIEGATREAGGDAAAQAQTEITDTIARVSELIVLPEGEEPTIATVTDPEKLKDQEFFKNAKPGYRVLLYTKARKAYLYDPQSHKLIEVAPITTELQ